VKERKQVYNPRTKRWVKIDTKTHLFIDQFARKNTRFKGVRRHK
jgi:hypothetical protein